MKKTLLVMRHELSRTLRRKSFVFFGFGLPLLAGIVALVLIATRRDAPPPAAEPALTATTAERPQGLVDEGDLISSYPPDFPAGWLVEYPDQDAAASALARGEIGAYAVIPAGYVASGEILYVVPAYSPLTSDAPVAPLERLLLWNVLAGQPALAERVWQPLALTVRSLAPPAEAADDSWIADLLPNAMSLLLYLTIILSATVLVQAVTDEKKNRVLEVLLSSVSAGQMLTGKIVAVALLGLLMMAAWLAVLLGVITFGGVPLNIPPGYALPRGLIVWAAVYGLLGYAIYGAQMAGLGAVVPDLKDTRGASMVVLLPMIAVYILLIFIITAPNGPLAVALSLFPLTSPIAMITRMTLTAVPLWQGLLAAVLQLLAAGLIVWLVVRLFRAQVLLSGQPFSLKRYYGLLLRRNA